MQAYLDNSATTKCAPEVVDVCVKVMQEDYGNPSSKHMKGVEAEKYIKDAKEIIAKTLKCQEKEILFTSGGTESNNMAVIGNEEKVIFISINSEKMKVYDIVKDEENEIDLDVPAMIVDESTMIPLRAVSEALGANVEWNQQSNTVSLNI